MYNVIINLKKGVITLISIYIIENTKNGKVYIGQVGQGKNTNFNTRINNHYKSLNRGKHKNKHLQSAWNQDGEENFIYERMF